MSDGFTDEQLQAWRRALDLWGVQLHPPRSAPNARQSSFAWFSFPPQVFVDLVEAKRKGVAEELETIFAHEIGHHVLSPSTRINGFLITQQIARALAVSLPHELAAPATTAGLLSNLWSDLLINDRVVARQRSARPEAEPNMVRMWRRLARVGKLIPMWWLVMRTYELLWELAPGTLCPPQPPRAPAARRAPELVDWLRTDPRADAIILAETVRTFADSPVRGALRFGMIIAPYVANDAEPPIPGGVACAGDVQGGSPTAAELDAVLSDARLSEEPRHPLAGDTDARAGATPSGPTRASGQGYGLADTQRLWADVPAEAVLEAWYTAEARRWVRPLFQPADEPDRLDETIPGAGELWELHDDVDRIDWPATLVASPHVIPGITTRQRTELPDAPPQQTESIMLDLYIDSSGSMIYPSAESPAVLAGMILVLSTLRGGGRVQVTTFSGPSEVAGTEGFTRDRAAAAGALLHYFGDGTTFPLDLLARRYARVARPSDHVRRHLVVLSDDGLSSMFGAGQETYSDAAARIRPTLTTATLVLAARPGEVQRLAEAAGYRVDYIPTMAEAPQACARLAVEIAGGTVR